MVTLGRDVNEMTKYETFLFGFETVLIDEVSFSQPQKFIH